MKNTVKIKIATRQLDMTDFAPRVTLTRQQVKAAAKELGEESDHDPNETFTQEEVLEAIGCFLSIGTLYARGQVSTSPGDGYYTGNGWAARCLRWHQKQLKKAGKS